MNSIDAEDIGKARPIDEVVEECERAEKILLKEASRSDRKQLEELIKISKSLWRAPFAFRGQAKQYRLSVRSRSYGMRDLISLHASEFRFVHELDWSTCWWEEDAGKDLRQAIQKRLDEDHARLTAWGMHLMSHPLTKSYNSKLLKEFGKRFTKDKRLVDIFHQPYLTTSEDRELQYGMAEAASNLIAFQGSLAQHYGLDSRFLDLSFSPKIAAWFALQPNWEHVLKGERVYGYIMRFLLPALQTHIMDYRFNWKPKPLHIADISNMPTTIAKRPSLQLGISLPNSPDPLFSSHLVGSGYVDCLPFYTRPCKLMSKIIKMDLYPKDDPFFEVINSFGQWKAQ